MYTVQNQVLNIQNEDQYFHYTFQMLNDIETKLKNNKITLN